MSETEVWISMCGRCYSEESYLISEVCDEKPEKLLGQPLGQYHCSDCGAMILAGIKHPPICIACIKEIYNS